MHGMRRALLFGLALGLALAGVAVASGYKTGLYAAGHPKTGAGVRMKVRTGSFSVPIIRYHETCKYGSRTWVDYFTFQSGSSASLRGTIDQSGRFSGRYSSSAGTAAVSGRLQGSTATINSSEHGPYNPATTVHPNSCRGSHTFQARLKTG
ncbi:MAG: hypothetical protein ACJ764_15705 [Solirubrobacteraceae bacterium]